MSLDVLESFLRKSGTELKEDLNKQIDSRTGNKVEFLVNQAWLKILAQQERPRGLFNSPAATFASGAAAAFLLVFVFNLFPGSSGRESVQHQLLQYSSLELSEDLDVEEDTEQVQTTYEGESALVVPGFGSIRFNSFEIDTLEESDLDDTQDNYSA